MAINSFNIICEQNTRKSISSAHSSKASNRVLKINMATDGSLTSSTSKSAKLKMSRSPYYAGDRVQLLSRVTEKRLVHKKTTDFVSSFPLAANIYKANSDEFKSSKTSNKKVKKSVLTLPNDPAPMPQVCTVSDMNDSEYCDLNEEDRKQKVIKKRIPIQKKRKVVVRDNDLDFYDRDCSQMHIDSSSTDIIRNFNGDGMRITRRKKLAPANKTQTANNNNLSDVWAVLRNMNRFQFRPSPPMSDESNILPIKKKTKKKRTNRKDTRVFETCTEEFAYIQSYELDGNSQRSITPVSSIDRITVIDKKNEIHKICQEFEERLIKAQGFIKENPNRAIKNKIQRSPKTKSPGNVPYKDNKQLMPLKKKKKINFKSRSEQPAKNDQKTISSDDKIYFTDADMPFSSIGNSDVVLYNSTGVYKPTSIAFSENSGSSKAESPAAMALLNGKPHSPIMKGTAVGSNNSPVKGISKIVLSKPGSPVKQFEAPKRKARLVTTMPSSNTVQKLAQTEIRRRLNHLKFPIVILGKDQVCSNIKVVDYDFPQFNGLDKHIWPFMMEWTEHHKHAFCPEESRFLNISKYRNYQPSPITEIIISDQNLREKKSTSVNNDLRPNKNKTESRPVPSQELKEKTCFKKQKSIVQLKDKMLNFLYKKSPTRCNLAYDNNEHIETNKGLLKSTGTGMTECKALVDNKYDTNNAITKVVPKNRVILSPVPTIKRHPTYAHPWAKAKWASEFIENVIKKIKNGVYYTQDNKDIKRKYKREFKEASIQAGKLCGFSDYTQTYVSDTEYAPENFQDKSIFIPGFDDALPALEITTCNPKQIAVRNRVTNIMVQFDVSIPVKCSQSSSSLKRSPSLIRIEETESHTNIFKCKTTILNAMLPAELCTILPKMMNTIVVGNENTSISFAVCPTKTDSCLSTIIEGTRETPEIIPSILPPLQYVSPEVTRFFGGRFMRQMWHLKPHNKNKVKFIVDYLNDYRKEMLPKIKHEKLALWSIINFIPEMYIKQESHTEIPVCDLLQPAELTDTIDIKLPTCTTMAIPTTRNKTFITSFKQFDLMRIVNNVMNNHNMEIYFNFTTYYDLNKLKCNGDNNIHIDVSISNDKGEQKNLSVTVNSLEVDSLYTALPKKHLLRSSPVIKCIEYEANSLGAKPKNTEVCQVVNNKIKRKGFHRIYRKCKSTSNIPAGDKSVNTPLTKITNLEDFFQILGSKKMLCSVIDGYAAKKILSSIIEMKNWITEINPRQALLILLLTNKKDTPNLVRFRPVLLQGIAVNRITRASELDMEIEVIERENLNKFSQYEGISYLPETVTNYENLSEELYWIAKTTASDYQRPFDESSERLLRSLLEKRKKLNPSYLRVMARYVGLGLLKSPTKN